MADKILVVDDEIALQETLSYNLKKEGYIVEVAGNGLTALELFRFSSQIWSFWTLCFQEWMGLRFAGHCAKNPTRLF